MRIRFKYHLRALPWMGPVGVGFFVLIFLLRGDTPGVIIMLSMFMLMFLPVAFLHTEYFLENRGKVIEIDNRSVSVFEKNRLVLRYDNSELERIEFYKAHAVDIRGFYRFPTQYYFYTRFVPRGGKKEIVVTSLVTSGYLEEVYNRGVKLEIKWSFFPSIRYPVVVKAESRPA